MVDIDLNLGLRIVQVVVFPLVAWIWSRMQEQKKTIAAQNEEIDELRDRVVRCETQIENTPSKESVHELMLSLSEMNGGMKAMEARLEGLGGTVRRSERVMERVESYLLEKSG